MGKRERWTAQKAAPIVAAWRESGLTVRAFARREGLEEQKVNRWRHLLASGTPALPTTKAFVPVRIAFTKSEDRALPPLEVALRGGHVLRLSEGFDAEAVAKLLAALEKVAPC